MLHPALLPFLDGIDKLPTTLAWRESDRLERYQLGTQYADRELDADGYRASGVYGTRSRTPSWKERRIDAVWNLRAETSQKLTDWTLGGSNWCHLEVPGDELAEDFLATVADQAGMAAVLAEARTFGGTMRVAIVSFAVHEGEFLLEAHRPKGMRVLEWADPRRHRPRAIVQVMRGANPDATSERDYPWVARYWDEHVEATLSRVRDPMRGWRWVEDEVVVHGLGACPVFWCPNTVTPSADHMGVTDADNVEGLIDEANELLAAAGCTTKRNADDTLVVHTSPDNNPGKPIRKGGFNAIFAEGGAEYLSQSGDSARICFELARERASQVYRSVGIDLVDPKDAASQTSGEARKMANLNTAARAALLRNTYARGLIEPLCRAILQAARKLPPGSIIVPPRFDADGKPAQRGPGKGTFVRCAWPSQFPPTATDTQALVTTAATATGGKQVMSQRTAVKMLAANGGVPIENVDEEIEAIEEDGERAAEQSAIAMGPGPLAPGAAGAIDDEPADDEGKGAAA